MEGTLWPRPYSSLALRHLAPLRELQISVRDSCQQRCIAPERLATPLELGAEAANDIGPKLTYSSAACRVAMGTYPASKPAGGVTINAGSIAASFPILGGARYSRSFFQLRWFLLFQFDIRDLPTKGAIVHKLMASVLELSPDSRGISRSHPPVVNVVASPARVCNCVASIW